MKTIHIFETAEELVKAFQQVRAKGDESPWLGNPTEGNVIVVDTDGTLTLRGKAADAYRIDNHVLYEDVVQVLLQNARLPVEQLVEKEAKDFQEVWYGRPLFDESGKQSRELHVTRDEGLEWHTIDISKYLAIECDKGRLEILRWVKQEIVQAEEEATTSKEFLVYLFRQNIINLLEKIDERIVKYAILLGYEDFQDEGD